MNIIKLTNENKIKLIKPFNKLKWINLSGRDSINDPIKYIETDDRPPAVVVSIVPSKLPNSQYLSANENSEPHIDESPAPRKMFAVQRINNEFEKNRSTIFEPITTER